MSVKTGAVGSNPKIDKLINADADSLRRFAATTMLAKIMQTSAPVTRGSDENQVDPATAEAGRKTIRDNIMKTPASGNLEKGNYVKESDKENAIQKSLGMVVEMQRQKQAASTLAFAEDDAMKRNGIAEEDRKEFFANYLTLESEYLVEGAMLTCTQATNEMIELVNPIDATVKHQFEGEYSKTENPLMEVKNPANDGKKKYATVSDCDFPINIFCFRNCKLSKFNNSKVFMRLQDSQRYGTCFALMDLCEKWINVVDGAAYGTAGAEFKNCINMLSHLGCYQGGIIFPLNTGQGELEGEVDFEQKAIDFGAMEFEDKENIIEKAELANLVARVIYAEQTNNAPTFQEAVAWTIINRLLSQDKGYGIDGKVNLVTVLTREYQYSALIKEDDNEQAFTIKQPSDNGWEKWVNAVRLGYYVSEAFKEYSSTTDLSKEELDGITDEIVDNIGESPIRSGVSYRADYLFDKIHTVEGGKEYITEGGIKYEIKPNSIDKGGNIFFDYAN